jgi:NAD(P)-dependent dehydrogenase (short-subunit alcohol dehydrogenase family)
MTGSAVVITGGSRGLGQAIAHHFLQAGATVVIGGIDPNETSDAADAFGDEFGRETVQVLAGDISQPDGARPLIDLAVSGFGKLDAVVCNAGIDIIKPAIDYDPAEWDRRHPDETRSRRDMSITLWPESRSMQIP